jgi:GPH family glycoside/pentoside/hexuronide:cation symporter
MSPSPPKKTPRLGFATKLGYGVGSVASVAAGTALATGTLTIYLNQVIGLPVALVGIAIMLSLIFDAVVDPLIGIWSDNTNTRWGRRHPFMYAAAIPCAVCIYLLWHTPASWPPEATFALVMALLIAVRFFVGLYDTTSAALAPELAPDYNDRTTLLSYRWLFVTASGAPLALLLNVVFLRKDAAHPLGYLNRAGYAQFGTVVAVVIGLAILIAALATHRLIPYLAPARRPENARAAFRDIATALTNPSLMALMVVGIVGGMTNGISATVGPYLFLHFWNLLPQTMGWLTLIGLPAAILGALVTPFFSRWLGKKGATITLFLVSIIGGQAPMLARLIGWLPAKPSPTVIAILAADGFVSAVVGLSAFILISSMVADVVEDVATKTGKRSEGLLFAANGLLPKISAAAGGLVGALLLSFVKFPIHAQQGSVDPAILRNLAYIYMPVTALLSIGSVLLMGFFRIDQATHERNLAILAQQGLAHLPEPSPDGGAGGLIAAVAQEAPSV